MADDRGRPVAFALTPGNVADVVMAIPLLGAVAKPKRLLADKAYDADSLRRWLKQRKIRAAIPSTASRRTPYPLDRAAYKRRNVIERMFCKLKNWRRIATRYDQLARQLSLAASLLAAIIICLDLIESASLALLWQIKSSERILTAGRLGDLESRRRGGLGRGS